MNIRTGPDGVLKTFLEYVRPSFVKVAALCLRDSPAGREVMLVRTFQRQHWIIPKGWPMKNRTLAEAAACEAWEEAGVRGRLRPEPIGSFRYTKIRKSGLPVQCRAHIFRIDVETVDDVYPEAGKRQRQWASLPEAAAMVHNPELSAFLRSV